MTEGNIHIFNQQSKKQITSISAVLNDYDLLKKCQACLNDFYNAKEIEAMQIFLRTLFVVEMDAFVPLDYPNQWGDGKTPDKQTPLMFFLKQFDAALNVLEEMYRIMVFHPEFETNKSKAKSALEKIRKEISFRIAFEKIYQKEVYIIFYQIIKNLNRKTHSYAPKTGRELD